MLYLDSADAQLPCSRHVLKQFHQLDRLWLWQIQEEGRGLGFYLVSNLHICTRMWFVSLTMVIRTAVSKSFCLMFDRDQNRCMHCACNVVLFLFYVCTTYTCACNKVKNREDLGLTILLKTNCITLALSKSQYFMQLQNIPIGMQISTRSKNFR